QGLDEGRSERRRQRRRRALEAAVMERDKALMEAREESDRLEITSSLGSVTSSPGELLAWPGQGKGQGQVWGQESPAAGANIGKAEGDPILVAAGQRSVSGLTWTPPGLQGRGGGEDSSGGHQGSLEPRFICGTPDSRQGAVLSAAKALPLSSSNLKANDRGADLNRPVIIVAPSGGHSSHSLAAAREDNAERSQRDLLTAWAHAHDPEGPIEKRLKDRERSYRRKLRAAVAEFRSLKVEALKEGAAEDAIGSGVKSNEFRAKDTTTLGRIRGNLDLDLEPDGSSFGGIGSPSGGTPNHHAPVYGANLDSSSIDIYSANNGSGRGEGG
ncbi:unnamed protein product, partial [Discosporangium mesarthrocarpum]